MGKIGVVVEKIAFPQEFNWMFFGKSKPLKKGDTNAII